MTFGEKVIAFHEQLIYTGNPLPKGVRVMNPFIESAKALDNIRLFTKRYIDDTSRLGAKVTGLRVDDHATQRSTQRNELQLQRYSGINKIGKIFYDQKLAATYWIRIEKRPLSLPGIGKNARFLNAINNQHHFFGKSIPLEHPRFIMQYRSAEKKSFIGKYLRVLCSAER